MLNFIVVWCRSRYFFELPLKIKYIRALKHVFIMILKICKWKEYIIRYFTSKLPCHCKKICPIIQLFVCLLKLLCCS